MITVEDKIAKFVSDKSINIASLAKKMGMSYVTAYYTFSGNEKKRKIKADELLKFCAIMGVDPLYFAPEESEECRE